MGRVLLVALLALVALVALVGIMGCGSPGPGSCVAGQGEHCATLYPTITYSEIFRRTFQPRCDMDSCHGVNNPGNGLILHDPDQAYDLLVGKSGGRPRVIGGNVGCSLLVERLESSDAGYLMPRGAPLMPSERCDVELWIQMGAPKN